jgi:exopolysaccharide biosynthesis polyprenyl glycosylphosphotransferase
MNMAASDSISPNRFSSSLETLGAARPAISRELFRAIATISEISADFFTCVGGIFVANAIYYSLHIGKHLHYHLRQVASVAALVGLLVVLLLQTDGAYRDGGSMLQIRETERAIRIPIQSLFLLLPFSFLLDLYFSRAAFLIAFFLIPVLLIAEKQIFLLIVRRLHAGGYGIDRVVIYGAGDTARRIVSALLYSPKLGLRPVAVIDDVQSHSASPMFEQGYRRNRSVPVLNAKVTPELLSKCRGNLLIVADPNLSPEKLAEVAYAAKQAKIRTAFLPGPTLQDCQWTELIDIDGLLLTTVADRLAPWHYAFAKRAADLALSAFLLLLLAPALMVIGLLIRLDSPGPAFFVQNRVGRNGRILAMYKFRSMYLDAPHYDISPVTAQDDRITRIGRFIRRTSLDELPQLLNVLRGDMSLVGPRPEMPFIVQQYSARHRQRHEVIPGITGLWQLSADRTLQIHENIQYDLYYIRNRTFFLDMAILVHTLFFAMRGV